MVNIRSNAPQSHAWKLISDVTRYITRLITNLQLCHEHLQHEQEFSSTLVGGRLFVEALLEFPKEFIEARGLDDGPRNDRKLSAMQLGDEIIASLVTNYLIEL
jgi:hypothetical protein